MEQRFTRIFILSIKTITKTDRCTPVNWGDIWFDFKNFNGNNLIV